MKKLLSLFVIAVISVSSVFAEVYKVEDLVKPEVKDFLVKNGVIVKKHEKEEKDFRFMPDTLFKDKINSTKIKKDDIPYMAEYLYLIPKSKLLEGSSKKELTINDLEKVVRKVSGMQGMRYHFSKKYPEGEDVLYKKCYNISDPSSDDPIPDVMEGPTNGLETYCLQNDHTYGDTKYKLNYYLENGILYCTFLNKKPMGFLGINAVKNDSLRINLVMIDCGDSILLYLTCDVNAQSILFVNVRKQIGESMSDRMEAIYKWFLLQFK